MWSVRFNGELRASVLYAEDAAILVAGIGDGAVITCGNSREVLWEEGKEEQPAAESYDFVAETVEARNRSGAKRRVDGAKRASGG